ncbi:hypothetical protein K3495_g6997 [Podosphaera aphanis]|nr:hypothetical protein K3495_g6997 [Podosphaera aphanis]
MSLHSIYKSFLAQPSSNLLAEDASLHYISTLVSINGSSAILKHFKSNQVNVKTQEFLDVVEGPISLAIEVETTLQFLNGGGSYLPALDDNFIDDRNITLPIVHFITFDSEKKITQIRLSWDQGSLLKLINIIGKTGRNWPISDGKDQIKLITSSLRAVGNMSSKTAAIGTENIYGERSKNGSTIPKSRSSSKPPLREYKELFVGSDYNPGSTANIPVPGQNNSSESENFIASKAGATKKYGPSRLFDQEEIDVISPQKSTNPAKFKHFDFGETAQEEVKTHPLTRVKPSNHDTHWDFNDFVTPQKVAPSKVIRTNELRHWGNSDDEVLESPERTKKPPKPRKEIETHFQFQDDGSPEKMPRIVGRPIGQAHNDGHGLYKDLFDEQNGCSVEGEETRVPNLANVKDRQKDFEAHFTMTDRSPGLKDDTVTTAKTKAAKMMEANWNLSDQLPTQKENISASSHSQSLGTGRPLGEATNTVNRNEINRGIKTDGDGMGGKKGATRSWGFGDDSDGEEMGGINKPGIYKTGKQTRRAQPTGGDFWDF